MRVCSTIVIGLVIACSGGMSVFAEDDEQDVETTLPGVLVRYSVTGSKTESAESVEAVVAVPRLFGKAGQSPHLGVPANGFHVEWSGVLLIPYQGQYTLTARRQTLTDLSIVIDDQAIAFGSPVELSQGPVPFKISGIQTVDESAFELWWRSTIFPDEPIEARHFRYDPARLTTQEPSVSDRADRGMVLAETHGCIRCHSVAEMWSESLSESLSAEQTLPGPKLDDLGRRVNASWLFRWIKNPQTLRHGTPMPHLFADSADEDRAARTIAAYLFSRNGSTGNDAMPEPLRRGDSTLGEAHFKVLGCAACHAPPPHAITNPSQVSAVPVLDKMAEKWTPIGLANFLQKPLDSRSHGRMPDFSLTPDEAANIAAFLLAKENAGTTANDDFSLTVSDSELSAQWRLIAPPGSQELSGTSAERLAVVAVVQMGLHQCHSCHDVPSGTIASIERHTSGSPTIRFADSGLNKIRMPTAPTLNGSGSRQTLNPGCLAVQDKKGTTPDYDFSTAEREALTAYFQIRSDNVRLGTPDRLRVDLATLNCLRCHDNEGHGGESLAGLLGDSDHSKYFRAPMLTRVGERVRQERLEEWIGQGARTKAIRPWVGARMPGFGGRATRIAAALAMRDGAIGSPVLTGKTAPTLGLPIIEPKHLQTGRFLVGTKALACINCHALGGTLLAGPPDPTTRGPDLTVVADHLRPEYFSRWIMNPARIQPGTKMPQAIQPTGLVAIASLKDLPPGGAMNALWTYLNQGANALAPVDQPTVLVTPNVDQPAVQRGEVDVGTVGKLPRTKWSPGLDFDESATADNRIAAGKYPRAVTLGFADGTILFDADQLTIVAGWYGGFVKPSPSPYFGLWWLRDKSEVDMFTTKPHPLSFELAGTKTPQTFALPLESDPNQGTRFEGYQIGKSSVRLKYRILLAGHLVTVMEDIRVETRSNWQGFARELRFLGLPAGSRTVLELPLGGDAKTYTDQGTKPLRLETPIDSQGLTFQVNHQMFAAVIPTGTGAQWAPPIPVDSRPTDNAPVHPAARLVSAESRENAPLRLRVDLWFYRGQASEPSADEIKNLIENPPILNDDFDGEMMPPAPVTVAQFVDATTATPKLPSRTRAAINPRENIDEFPPVEARFLRFNVSRASANDAPGLDELEVYGADPKVNLGLTGKATASSVIKNQPFHQIHHLNDGKLGNEFSWIGGEDGKGWVMLEWPQKIVVRSIVWGRDRTGGEKDRLPTGYHVQVSEDGVNFHTVSDDGDRILHTTSGTSVGKTSPSYEMQSLELPFDGCRMSDIAFSDDGTLYALAMTEGQVWRTKTPPADHPHQIRWQRFASGLYHPIGIQIVEGRVFVAQKPEITELIDRDGDGTADQFRTLASGWGLSDGWHEYTFGLAVDAQKNLWFALNTGYFWTNPGYVHPGRWRGSVMRFNYESDNLAVIAKGCRVPNGITCGIGGDVFFSDNQGDWTQSCKLAHVVQGRFYGHPEYKEDALAENNYPDGRSAVWMPYNLSRSTSGPVCDTTSGLFGPFAGQLFVGDVGYGGNPGITRVALEKVDGEYQGAVLRFVDGQPLGCERMKFGPDNQLYMASLTSGLTRLKYKEKIPFEIEKVTIRPAGQGFVIHLTRPLTPQAQLEAADFRVRRYHYLYTGNYGSPEADVTMIPVIAAELSPNRTSITLSFPVETHPISMVYEINTGKLMADDGEILLHNEAWYTVNRIPK